MAIQGSSAIVTGGAVGLGRCFATALARAGARVTICDIRDDVEHTAAQLRAEGLTVEGVIADVSEPQDVRRLVDDVVARQLDLIEEGPEGRSGDNIGLWVGHPTALPAPSPILDLAPELRPDDISAPLFAYMS
jgi:NAD(P)-dependent dehydrogenase (short-subunit alcohol dehydrogenase family)